MFLQHKKATEHNVKCTMYMALSGNCIQYSWIEKIHIVWKEVWNIE